MKPIPDNQVAFGTGQQLDRAWDEMAGCNIEGCLDCATSRQFAVNAWRTAKQILHAHPVDQRAQLRLDLRSPSQRARLPTPVATKAGPMPTHEGLGPDQPDATMQLRLKTLAKFSESAASNHTPFSADFTITTPVFKLSRHTTPRDLSVHTPLRAQLL
jgi:hypothetical protein